MPNCDFYAVPNDHQQLLDWLFREGTCRLFELYSDFEKPLREFCSVEEVMSLFSRAYSNGKMWDTLHLRLYVLDAGPSIVPRRVKLDPKACNGATFRYAAEGWGLVQLYLAAEGTDGLKNSHTSHFSLKRAGTWASTIPESQPIALWDFKRITAFSSRLNRQIKKMSVATIGRRAVLSGALGLWEKGIALLPFRQDGTVAIVRAGT